jgi:hypothetical protein
MRRRDLVQRDVVGVEDDLESAGIGRVEEVLHHLLLAVDHDARAAGERGHVDTEHLAVAGQSRAGMHQALGAEAGVEAEAGHEVDRDLFEHAGAHAALDVGAVAALDHDAVHVRLAQQVSEEHAGRTGADDGDLGADIPPPSRAPHLIVGFGASLGRARRLTMDPSAQ